MPNVRAFILFEVILLVSLLGVVSGRSQNATPPADDLAGRVYPVRQFQLEYGPHGVGPHPDLPPIASLPPVKVELGRRGDLYVAPGRGDSNEVITLETREGQGVRRFSPEALISINRALAGMLNDQGFYGVWVAPDNEDLDPDTAEDRRAGRPDLRLIIHTIEVKELRSVAKGQRIPADKAIDHPAHRRIVRNSPLQPPHDESRGSLLDKDRLDRYVSRLNRFPGRSVDAAISSSGEPGGVVLDYLVTEDKPWVAYAQVSNTGTEDSSDWRERFGFIHQQLTHRDDILSLDYTTGDFEFSHAFFGSYEIPLIFPDRLKAKVFGSYSKFRSEEVALNVPGFRGDFWSAGGELIYSPWSLPPFDLGRVSLAALHLDFTAGARWQAYAVENRALGSEADTDLFLPYAGVGLSSISQKVKVSAGVQLEGNLSSVADTDTSSTLGRFDLDDDFLLLKGGAGLSFFLDPFWSPKTTRLIHELAFSGQGQYAFGHKRLIPTQQELVGGFYSVRGYPESIDAGDSGLIGSAEYRLYLARLFRPNTGLNVAVGAKMTSRTQFGNPFRFRPRDVYGRPDWELIFRTFADAGRTVINDPQPSERERNLLGVGAGLELQVRRNLTIRCDYAFALVSQKANVNERVDRGDGRVHFSATLAW